MTKDRTGLGVYAPTVDVVALKSEGYRVQIVSVGDLDYLFSVGCCIAIKDSSNNHTCLEETRCAYLCRTPAWLLNFLEVDDDAYRKNLVNGKYGRADLTHHQFRSI